MHGKWELIIKQTKLLRLNLLFPPRLSGKPSSTRNALLCGQVLATDEWRSSFIAFMLRSNRSIWVNNSTQINLEFNCALFRCSILFALPPLLFNCPIELFETNDKRNASEAIKSNSLLLRNMCESSLLSEAERTERNALCVCSIAQMQCARLERYQIAIKAYRRGAFDEDAEWVEPVETSGAQFNSLMSF